MLLKKYKDINKKTVLTYLVVFIISYLVLLSFISPKKYDLNVGDIAISDIKAPVDTVDEATTKEKEEEAASKVDKQYTIKSEVESQAKENIEILFNSILLMKEDYDKSKLKDQNEPSASQTEAFSVKKVEGFDLEEEEYLIILNQEKKDIENLKLFLLESIEEVYKDSIEENNDDNLQRAKNLVDDRIQDYGVDRDLEEVTRKIAYSQIKANMFFDSEKTEEKILEAKKSVEKEIIKKNQIIVKEGEPVTQRQIDILNGLGLLDGGFTKSTVKIYLSLAAIIAITLAIQYYYLAKDKKDIIRENKNLTLISSINTIIILISIGLSIISPYLISLICSTMIMAILLDNKLALIVNLLNIVFIGVITGFDTIIIITSIISVIIASIAIKRVQQRDDIIYSTLYVTLVSVAVVASISLLNSNDINDILAKVIYTAIGGILSGILAVGLLPFYESIFGVVTNIKLLELSNPNQPLMKRLLMEAPGTYHHSMMVANLAESATEAVGGNAVLSRVGAYYHDIGKIKRPYFFGENQMGKENPHNKIKEDLSALIILSHTKDGVELAKEHKIPKILQDIMVQHHGTTLVKYFYYKAKNAADNPEDIKEEDFRYSGPIPNTKESGIIMLADSVEAAVRSINEPTKLKIEEMVNNIINDKINSNQLIDCDLTLKDIEIIRQSFLKSLNSIYHQRIEYPTERKRD